MVMEIRLSEDLVALVDDDIYVYFSNWCWQYAGGYASRDGSSLGKLLLHKEIWKFYYGKIPEGKEIDHINRDKLDCRKENLRLATRSQNAANMKPYITNTSGYKGVHFATNMNKWKATIRINGEKVHLGFYKNINEAARAYNIAAKKHFGEFAYLNIIEE